MAFLQDWSPLTDLLGSLIEAAGIVVAAKIGVKGFDSITQKRIDNYQSKNHDLGKLLMKAEVEITIVAAYGDELLNQYASTIADCMRHGIAVRYLMHTIDAAEKMNEDFLCRKDARTKDEVINVRKKLHSLHSVGQIEVREWNQPLTASYIGIDLNQKSPKSEPTLQIMTYLYNTPSNETPISYITYKEDYKHFLVTVNSINQMWDNAIFVDTSPNPNA